MATIPGDDALLDAFCALQSKETKDLDVLTTLGKIAQDKNWQYVCLHPTNSPLGTAGYSN